MIQLNLLPDIKLDFLKAQRIKRLVILATFGVSAASIALVIILCFVVFVWDRKSINDLTGDIKKYSNQLGNIDELNKTLTVQNQLKSLQNLHNQKPILSRVRDILTKVIPNEVSLTNVTVDTKAMKITMTGQAKTLERANTFADTLKFAYYTTPEAPDKHKQPFKAVSLQSVSYDGKTATMKVSMTYDPVIFNKKTAAVVSIEKGKITSRAEIEKPNPLFINSTEEKQ